LNICISPAGEHPGTGRILRWGAQGQIGSRYPI
jgi:hypothetical protein